MQLLFAALPLLLANCINAVCPETPESRQCCGGNATKEGNWCKCKTGCGRFHINVPSASCCPIPPREAGEMCRTSDQCASGLWCMDGSCIKPQIQGSTCYKAAHCQSNFCRANICRSKSDGIREANGKSCRSFSSPDVNSSLSTSRIELPKPSSQSGSGVFYSTSKKTSYHAIAYDDIDDKARVAILSEKDEVLKSAVVGTDQVEGISFDPSGEHLVVLLAKRQGPATFIKLLVPSLDEVFRTPFESPMVSLGSIRNDDQMAIGRTHYVYHNGGGCRDGQWCAGHQGSVTQAVRASDGQHDLGKGGWNDDWQASHSMKQASAYNPDSNTFMLVDCGDAYPKGVQATIYPKGKKVMLYESWGSERGHQGCTSVKAVASHLGKRFAVLSNHRIVRDGPSVKMIFALMDSSANVIVPGKQVFGTDPLQEFNSGVAPIDDLGRWFVAYSVAEKGKHSAAFESRIAILDAEGELQGETFTLPQHVTYPGETHALSGIHGYREVIEHVKEVHGGGVAWAQLEKTMPQQSGNSTHVVITRALCNDFNPACCSVDATPPEHGRKFQIASATQCPSGTQVNNEAECQRALAELNLTVTGSPWQGDSKTCTSSIPDDGEENGIVWAHWDQGSCGKMGNDHNLGFCGHGGKCPASIKSSTCKTGTASLVDVRRDATIDGCKYYWLARFRCDVPALCYRWESGSTIQNEEGTSLPTGPASLEYKFFCPDLSSLKFKVEVSGQSTKESFYPEVDGTGAKTWNVDDVSAQWKTSSPSPVFLVGKGNHVLKLHAGSGNTKIRQLRITTIETPACSKTQACQFGSDPALDGPMSLVCAADTWQNNVENVDVTSSSAASRAVWWTAAIFLMPFEVLRHFFF